MADVQLKTYNTIEAAAKNDEFYAINTSDLRGTQSRGQVVIGIKNSEGEQTKILFPATWIPIDLTQHVSPDSIKGASSLRTYLQRGLITLIEKTSYDMLTSHPAYKEEFERVSKLMGGYAAGGSNNTLTLNVGSAPSMPVGGPGSNASAVETVITRSIIDATPESIQIERYDSALQGLQLGDYRWLIENSTAGSLIQSVSMEMENLLISGGTMVKSIKELQSFKDRATTASQGPSISY